MVDLINFSPVNFKGSTNLIEQYKEKQSTNNLSVPADKPVTASAADALSNYNKVSVKTAEPKKVEMNAEDKALALVADLKPTEPTKYDMANFKGEEVKSSDGITDYFEEKNGDVSKIYNAFDGKVYGALEVNNKTGNKIKEEFISENGNTTSIKEFDPQTGKLVKTTLYDDKTGKLDLVSETPKGNLSRRVFYDENGKVKNIMVVDEGIDGGANVCYSFENGKLTKRIVETKDGEVLESNRYFEGKEVSSMKPKLYPVVNTSGIDYSKIDVKPAELGNVELDPNKVAGEKKFRSNGTLEKVVVKDGNLERTYNMDYTGKKLGQIVESENNVDKRIIRTNDEGKMDCIDEFDSNGKLQKSTYFENGNVDCVVDKTSSPDGKEKSVSFFPDGKVQVITVWDSAGKMDNSLEFDKSGNLIRCDEFDENNKNKNTYYNRMILGVENKTESPNNEKAVEAFKTALNDPNWEKTYVEGPNIVHMKRKGVMDGLEYEIFANGTVREYSNWGNDAIIMNSNQENADLFKTLSSAPKEVKNN